MIEKILGVGIAIGIILRDILGYRTDEPKMISGSLLAFIYLFGNWWLNKPGMVNARTILVTVLYGIASGSLVFALIFQLLYLTGLSEMSILSFAIVAFVFFLDVLLSINKKKIFNKKLAWRLSILSLTVGILFLIPKDYRISVTYRKYPEFLNCYQTNKEKADFDIIRRIYFHNYYEPDLALINCP